MSKRSRARNKQLRNTRKKQKAAAAQRSAAPSARTSPVRKLNRRTISRLAQATNLINDGAFEEAKEILTTEDRRHNGHPDILEDLLWLHQLQNNHHSAALVAERLLRVRPRDAEVRLVAAQSYLFCGRAPMALKAYREFLDEWPDHEYASKAEAALEIVEPQVAEMLVSFELSASRMEQAIEKARKLLSIKPHLVSARNNMALAMFQLGRMQDAVSVCRETLQNHPDNRFAEASLGRYLMLSGRDDEANVIADNIAGNPADHQDAIAQQVEFLSMLGRDDDVLHLVTHGEDISNKDSRCCALLCHHKAVALARQGKEQEAQVLWNEALDLDAHFDVAEKTFPT